MTIGFATTIESDTATKTSPINHYGYSTQVDYPGSNQPTEHIAVVMFHNREVAEEVRSDGIAEGIPTYSEVKPYHMPCGDYEINGIHYHCVDLECL